MRVAEVTARLTDQIKCDFTAFQLALASVEKSHDLWHMLKLDLATRESLGALFTEQKKRCEVTSLFLDSLVSRYDRFLNLV